MTARRTGLGRGLESLIPIDPATESGGFRQVPVDQIRVNPDQPRSRFDDESLEEMANSMKEVGILQPIVVTGADDGYVLIAGERRWRGCEAGGVECDPGGGS